MSVQRTEYRLESTGELLAVVPEHVVHHKGEFVVINHRYYWVRAVEGVVIERAGNDYMNCRALHVIKVSTK